MPTPPRPGDDAPAAMRLGWALRVRREGMPATRAQVAERLGYSPERVKQVERATHPAGVDYMARWVEVFGPLDGELRGLWEQARAEAAPPSPPALRGAEGLGLALPPAPEAAALYATVDDPDAQERLALAARSPSRVDSAVVTYLADVLAVHRRADDFLGPRHTIPVIKGQLRILDHLCAEAPASVRQILMTVACQYAQFIGWLYQDAGDAAAAAFWYDRTIEWALESGNGPMVATGLSMKANQNVGAQQPHRLISLADAAQRPEWGSPPAVHALAVQESAYGYALLGDVFQVERCLNVIEGLAERAGERRDETPWVYFFTHGFSTMQRAVVLRDIGRADAAIPMFVRGLATLPPDAKRERGQYLARLARAHTRNGDPAHALTLAEESAAIAAATGSLRTVGELRRLRTDLAEAGYEQAVNVLVEMITAAASAGANGNGDRRL